MSLHLEILPPPQRAFWDREATRVPRGFVLYGGTAIALRHGHRQSLDFDFFSSRPLDEAALRRALPVLNGATVLLRDPDSLVIHAPSGAGEVKLSFFGGLSFGRVGEPEQLPDHPSIASPLDLLATKLKVIHERVEAKDYLDIEVLLRSGLTLNEGIAAARALYGEAINPLMTAKAIAWFREGGLDTALSRTSRAFLEHASTTLDPAAAQQAMPLRSRELSPAMP